MYLFTRQVLLNPAHVRAGMRQALDTNRYVNENSSLEVSLFQVLQGAPLGTLTFAYRTESYAESMAEADKLLQSDEYMHKVESGAHFFVGNPQDHLAEYIHTSGTIVGAPAAASIVTATMQVDKAPKAIGWAIELADFMAKLSDVPTAVLTSNFGQYGSVAWLSYGSSLAQLEEAGKKINADAEFAKRMGRSEGLFVPGSGASMLSRRIG
jgi:hypothetical protein